MRLEQEREERVRREEEGGTEKREGKEETEDTIKGQIWDEMEGKLSCFGRQRTAGTKLTHLLGRHLVKNATKFDNFDGKLLRISRILAVVILETINLGSQTVRTFNFPADLEVNLDTVRVKRLSVFVNPENSFVGRHLFILSITKERKHRMKETHLTTPLRERQLHQFGTPAVALVSASQPSSNPKSSELHEWELVIGQEAGGICARRSRSASCRSEKGEGLFKGRVQGVCEAALSSIRSSSSEMSDRPWSSSEMESREGGMEDSEDDEEKERGNMKID